MKKLFISAALALFVITAFYCNKKEQTPKTEKTPLPAGEITYKIPDGWIEEHVSSQMRKAQFRLPGTDNNKDAELAVFYFPGTGGSVDMNISRWLTQFQQPDGRPSHDVKDILKINVNNLPITIVTVSGTYLNTDMGMGHGKGEAFKDYAMMAAIAETANGPWFFKAVGPQPTIDHWRKSFDEFIQTFEIKQNQAS